MSGHTEDRRPQLYKRSRVVTATTCSKSCGMLYWGRLNFSFASMKILLEPFLVDCRKDAIIYKRQVILKFRKFNGPVIDLLQAYVFDVHIFMLPAQFHRDGIGGFPGQVHALPSRCLSRK